MLVVLAEIDCLDYLQSQGIMPDEYYTDYEVFKQRCASFKNATELIILAGSCQFNKRHTTEFIKAQVKRQNNPNDKGISNVIVLTDYMIPTLELYYKFDDNLDEVYKCSGWKKAKTPTDIWGVVDESQTKVKHEIAMYLSDFDQGNAEKAREKSKSYYSKEEELIRLIQQPDVRQIILNSKTTKA